MKLKKDALVRHPRFGRGRVRFDDGDTVVVRFEHGMEECLRDDLTLLHGLEDKVAGLSLDAPLPVVVRVLAQAILSVNDGWGVFSRSRISLLPHQLWVCKRVLESWPTRWLVADDVGLGKTIEAGLILTPLLSSGRVKRLLILAPAGLVEQWQVRLHDLFDIRLSRYSPSVDTKRANYWAAHNLVVASAQTLRLDHGGRWKRLLDAEPWDMVMVDEAHHLNVLDSGSRTLAFELVERLQLRGRIRSMVLFTGTPHRGKDRAFLELLNLLRPGEFDPEAPLEKAVGKLRTVMIRNNKQHVTDMKGRRLFTPIHSRRETYAYSPEEKTFYEKLTRFILSGRAYASGLTLKQQRTVMLVLVTMQKLASSSVAAVRRALRRRLERIADARSRGAAFENDMKRLQRLAEEDATGNADEIARIEETILENIPDFLHLNPQEIPALEELLQAADAVREETKIRRILEVIEESFADRSVLFFTEYKATQALLMSALHARYGDGCVTFINGDGFIEGVKTRSGQPVTMRSTKQQAAARFNRGEVRFLVSTEAAGEGIDLQENCHTLFHVDLPWNPMRLHQRVGRLSRYGQKHPVDVVSIRNPDTVESRIWERLDEKLDRITLAFQGAMDDPEDMRQLVLGMASPRMFTRMFAEADPDLEGERLARWFDARTATFGGEKALEVVRNLVGNAARFDFGDAVAEIPKVDLPDLVPFFQAFFAAIKKRPTVENPRLVAFRTPKEWLRLDFALAEGYRLLFSRHERPEDDAEIAGVGHRVVDLALRVASERIESFAVLAGIDRPLVVFAVRDRVTGEEGAVRRAIIGVEGSPEAGWAILRDWEIIRHLNRLAAHPRAEAFSAPADPGVAQGAATLIAQAQAHVSAHLGSLDLPFRRPAAESIACLWPAHPDGRPSASGAPAGTPSPRNTEPRP